MAATTYRSTLTVLMNPAAGDRAVRALPFSTGSSFFPVSV
jgi:hypothetical protein